MELDNYRKLNLNMIIKIEKNGKGEKFNFIGKYIYDGEYKNEKNDLIELK